MIQRSKHESSATRTLIPTGILLCVMAGTVGASVVATCPPSCPATGGGPEESDCHAEFASPALRLNYPPFNPADPQPRTELRCFDGDAGCDTDGETDEVCVFDIDVCLRNEDPELASCTPTDVTSVEVAGADEDPDLQALQEAIDALLPATSNVCTTGQTLRVPLTEPNGNGSRQRGSKTVELTVKTDGGGTATDRLELSCVPRGWPSYGYNHANHRASSSETLLSPENASELQVKWVFSLNELLGGPAGGVTSTPTVGNGLVYVTTWTASVYALDPEDGSIVWSFTAPPAILGFQSSATLTADGRLLVALGTGNVYCFDALAGDVLWVNDIRIPREDHIWASPQVANGRVFVGIASLSDVPCTLGRLVALDLDTGEVLWNVQTVPDRICRNDTAIVCEDDTGCGEGGECIAARGAGVTATVAVDPTGELVYMNTVGCYTYPSIGDSDSIFKIEAGTGEVIWKNRVQSPEQFSACDNDGSIDCRSDADCNGGSCETKGAYHDFGFLNGPLLIDTSVGKGEEATFVVSGSKDGTLYALSPNDGSIAWTNVVQPTPITPGFAGFGLFNGAIGYADQRIHAALNALIPPRVCENNHAMGCNSDAQCGDGICLPRPEHLAAFSPTDGALLWSDEIQPSWSSVGIANGLVFTGTNQVIEDDEGNAVSYYYVYDAATGDRLNTFEIPAQSASGASIVDGTVYFGYGIFGDVGGVVALSLPESPTATPTDSPSPTATDAPTPTPTESPTETRAPTQTSTATPTETRTPSHTATTAPTTAPPPTSANEPEDDGCNLTAGPTSRTPWGLLPIAVLWVARRRSVARRERM